MFLFSRFFRFDVYTYAGIGRKRLLHLIVTAYYYSSFLRLIFDKLNTLSFFGAFNIKSHTFYCIFYSAMVQ